MNAVIYIVAEMKSVINYILQSLYLKTYLVGT
jgi:hypothetical protein